MNSRSLENENEMVVGRDGERRPLMPSQQELLLTGVEYGTPPHRDVNVNGEPLTPDGSGRSPNSRASAGSEGVCVCVRLTISL
jgi:hypothetical protein